jgi:SnoaL-like protein
VIVALSCQHPKAIMMSMTYQSMMAFAESWIAAWNRRDVDAVLAHYADTAQFISPLASNFVDRPILCDKKELEDYWRAALARISALEFKLDHAAWDERRRELNVVYEANLNGQRKRACEIMQFDASGRQISGEALYGAVLASS